MTDDSEIRRAALLRAQAGHDGELDQCLPAAATCGARQDGVIQVFGIGR